MEMSTVCPVCHATYVRRNRRQPPAGPCPRCSSRVRAKELRDRRAALGLCTRCGQPAPTGFATCQECSRHRSAVGFSRRH